MCERGLLHCLHPALLPACTAVPACLITSPSPLSSIPGLPPPKSTTSSAWRASPASIHPPATDRLRFQEYYFHCHLGLGLTTYISFPAAPANLF